MSVFIMLLYVIEIILKHLIIQNKKYSNHLDFLGPGLVSAAETIQKTKYRILKEAEKPLRITKKKKNDLVTHVDKASEALIIKEILNIITIKGKQRN